MKKLYSISQAAQKVGMTSETLRHYDRIGLVKPSETDPASGYRYYSQAELVRLSTIQALRTMDLSLGEIKKVLDYDDLEKIIDFLRDAETRADEKIVLLERSKEKIRRAREDYEQKLPGQRSLDKTEERELPQRAILLSEAMTTPTLANLWNYLSSFYRQILAEKRERFLFADMAGVYHQEERSGLFAVCLRYEEVPGLKILPAGTYLCAAAEEETRAAVRTRLLEEAKVQYNVTPDFTVEKIVISGILQWSYEIQVPVVLQA